jgi:hypothetical protein
MGEWRHEDDRSWRVRMTDTRRRTPFQIAFGLHSTDWQRRQFSGMLIRGCAFGCLTLVIAIAAGGVMIRKALSPQPAAAVVVARPRPSVTARPSRVRNRTPRPTVQAPDVVYGPSENPAPRANPDKEGL